MTTQQFLVRTVGAGFIREGRLVAPNTAAACRRAIGEHRKSLVDKANTGDKRVTLLKARTASILVSTVEVVTFAVGDTLGGDAA